MLEYLYAREITRPEVFEIKLLHISQKVSTLGLVRELSLFAKQLAMGKSYPRTRLSPLTRDFV